MIMRLTFKASCLAIIRFSWTCALVVLCLCGCDQHRKNKASGEGNNAITEENADIDIYYRHTDTTSSAWNDTVRVLHHWYSIEDYEYLFGAPSERPIAEWKQLCSDRNPIDSSIVIGVPASYRDMNQYVTLQDFIELWYHNDSKFLDDDLTLWRLAQYCNNESYDIPESGIDQFYFLKHSYSELLCYDPQFQYEMNLFAGLEADFQEFYDRVLVRESIRQSSPSIVNALEKEEMAWQSYHKELDSTFRVLDGNPSGAVGSAWPMAISGIAKDNAEMREESMLDYYYALTNSVEDITRREECKCRNGQENQGGFSDEDVLYEYRLFMNTLVEEECYYPVSERQRALERDLKAWEKWMKCRRSVSSLLTDQGKYAYDISTEKIRRHKYIMLKNRYQGYGLTSGDVLECLIPYTASDEEARGPSFDERWEALF
jgi:hypothetical protein